MTVAGPGFPASEVPLYLDKHQQESGDLGKSKRKITNNILLTKVIFLIFYFVLCVNTHEICKRFILEIVDKHYKRSGNIEMKLKINQ